MVIADEKLSFSSCLVTGLPPKKRSLGRGSPRPACGLTRGASVQQAAALGLRKRPLPGAALPSFSLPPPPVIPLLFNDAWPLPALF